MVSLYANILLIIPSSNTFSLCFSHNVRDQALYPYRLWKITRDVPEHGSCHRISQWMQTFSVLAYLHTPLSTVLLEKLTSSQIVKKFPTLYGTRRFITTFTDACHLSLSWARSIQSPPPICATCPTHLILLDLITWTIFGEESVC